MRPRTAEPRDWSAFTPKERAQMSYNATPTLRSLVAKDCLDALATVERLVGENTKLRDALDYIAKSYYWIGYSPEETVDDDGVTPTNRRVACEVLREVEAAYSATVSPPADSAGRVGLPEGETE